MEKPTRRTSLLDGFSLSGGACVAISGQMDQPALCFELVDLSNRRLLGIALSYSLPDRPARAAATPVRTAAAADERGVDAGGAKRCRESGRIAGRPVVVAAMLVATAISNP